MSSEPQAQTPMDNFTQRVYQVVAMIPEGRVATYGTIARLAGSPAPLDRWAAYSVDCLPLPVSPGTG